MDKYFLDFIKAKDKEGLSVEDIAKQVPYSIKDVSSVINLSHNKPNVFDPLDSLAQVFEQANKAIEEAKEVRDSKPEAFLTIELQEETSTPVVFYKGERITNLRELQLDWDQDTNVTFGGLTYAIEYAEKGNKVPVNHRIEREVKGHAID